MSDLTKLTAERRMRVWNQAKNLLDDVAAQGRDMTAEENTAWNRMNSEIDDLDAEIRFNTEREKREREAAQLRETHLSVFGEARVAQHDANSANYLRKWLQSANDPTMPRQLDINIVPALRERQMIRDGATPAEVRALAWDATSGSLVVPTSMARSIVDVLEANIAMFRMGATQLTTTSGENLLLPKLVSHGIGTQVSGQGTALAGTDPVFSNVALNAYKYGQLVKVSNELVTDAAFDIASWLGTDIGYALAHVIDADLVAGTGTGEPTGYTVLAGAGTNAPVTTGGSLIAPTVEKFIDLQYSINDTAREKAAWLMKDSVAGTVRKLRDGAGGTVGAFLWQPSMTSGLRDGTPDRFLGHPVYTDANCAAAGSAAVLATFGAPDEYVIRAVGNVRVERDDSVYFASDEIAFRGKWRVGGNHSQKSHVNQLLQNV